MRISDWSSDVCSSDLDGGAELSKTLTVSDCWIRSLPRPTPSAGYFVIKNAGNSEAKLASMSIAAFDQVSLHQTIDQDGKSRMAVADAVSIPAGGELEFKPGSYHAMLEKPTQALAVGKEVEADFAFQSGETAKALRSDEHTSELQSLMRNSYAVFCLKKTNQPTKQ